jgi:hypothetical protein
VYAPADCQVAARILQCGKIFRAPQLQTSDRIQADLGSDLYMPQFPDRSICTNYNEKCADTIAATKASTGVDLSEVNIRAL